MSLCDHSKLIHQQLSELRKNLNVIEVESRLRDWLSHLDISGCCIWSNRE